MLFNTQPALRHFAVLKRVTRKRFGTIWLVQDRRGFGDSCYLVTPSRKHAWPLFLKKLESLHSSPVRLRNGKIAVLVSGVAAKELCQLLTKNNEKRELKLNAMTGFESSNARISKKWFVIFGVVAILFLVVPVTGNTNADVSVSVKPKKVIDSKLCGLEMLNGEIVGQASALSYVSIKGEKFRIASSKRLGGLHHLKLKRSCDKKYLRVDAWFKDGNLVVAKVY